MVDKVKQGKKNKASGADFERRVRKDLTEKGWIVDKWGNQVEFTISNIRNEFKKTGELVKAKNKWAGPNRPMMMGAGFCDFIAFKYLGRATFDKPRQDVYDVIGVECKVAKYLDKIEKEKCQWYLENNIFSKILIASKYKEKNRIKIKYEEFKYEI